MDSCPPCDKYIAGRGLSPTANTCIHAVQADLHGQPCATADRVRRAHTVTILVTGGAGYIGSHMVHALHDSGEPVVVLDNLTTGFRWSLPKEALLVAGDSGDQALVAGLLVEHR